MTKIGSNKHKLENEIQIACYCESTEGLILRNRLRGGKRQLIARCRVCGMVQKVQKDHVEQYQLHKEGVQPAEINLDSMGESYTDRNLSDVTRRVDTLQAIIGDDDSSFLDFGTGMGYFMHAVSAQFDTVVGTEINETRADFVRTKLGFEVYWGIEHLREEFDTGSFDVVTMFHVLEHLPDPIRSLREIRDLLSSDGLLIIEVPNHEDWMLSISSAYTDFYYQDAHAWYFDPQTLRAALNKAGFSACIKGIQRYGYRNAIHWLRWGEPELEDPSRRNGNWAAPLDQLYGMLVTAFGRSDTILAICLPE